MKKKPHHFMPDCISVSFGLLWEGDIKWRLECQLWFLHRSTQMYFLFLASEIWLNYLSLSMFTSTLTLCNVLTDEANYLVLAQTFCLCVLKMSWKQTFRIRMQMIHWADTNSDSLTHFSSRSHSSLRPCSLWTQINSLLYCITYNLNLTLRSAIQS